MIEKVFFFLVVVVVLLIDPCRSLDSELTVLIPASQRECFHQELELGKTIEVEYEVLSGGDFDVNYWFYSPSSRVLQSEFKKRDGHHTLKLEETGEYRFCFDNSLSRFHQKQVYFSLRLLNEHDTSTEPWMKTIDRDDLGDLQSKVQTFKVSLFLFAFASPRLVPLSLSPQDTFQRIWDNMEAAQRYQNVFKNYEVQDRSVAEENFERVNFWSLIQLVVMTLVALIQVITIRSLFETKSPIGKILRGKK